MKLNHIIPIIDVPIYDMMTMDDEYDRCLKVLTLIVL